MTVIALCYNHARFLEEALDSIQAQTYGPIQLIIADDASTDGSPALIKSWIAERGLDHEMVFNDHNLGICASLNKAMTYAQGKYIAIVATDDVWLPNKLAVQVEKMESLPDSVGVAYADAAVIDEEGNSVRASLIRSWGFADAPDGDLFIQLLGRNPIPAPTALVRRTCFDAVGGYDETLSYEDLDMWLRIARQYRFVYLDEVLARYREVGTSLSRRRGTRSLESTVRIHLKWLGTTRASDLVLRRTLPGMVWRLYRHGDEHVSRYVGTTLRLAPGFHTLGMYVLVRLGVRHAQLRALKAALGEGLPK